MTNEEAIYFLFRSNEYHHAKGDLPHSALSVEAFNKAIEALKAARPQGEWIEKVERRGCFAGDKTVYSYTCPFCGVKEFKKYPFCHCGADMRKGGSNG